MPLARLQRTRRSLPEGYQFGDAGRGGVTVGTCGLVGFVRWTNLDAGADLRMYWLANQGLISALHPADTTDPDGYGHAV